MDHIVRLVFLTFILLLVSGFARAQELLPHSFTYQGRAYQADGVSPLAGNATFNVEVRSADGLCLLYEETHSAIDLTASNGFFALNIGEGSGSSGLAFDTLFNNLGIAKATLSGTCGGNYTPLSQDSRILRINVNVGGGPIALEDQYVHTVPQAMVAQSISGFKYNQLVLSLTTAQRNALVSPANNAMIYNITTGQFNRFNAGVWGVYSTPVTVSTDGSTISGNGSSGSPLAVNEASLDISAMTGVLPRSRLQVCANNQILQSDGTNWSCIPTPSGGGSTVTSDGVTIDGDGSSGDALTIIPAGIDIATLSGQLDLTQLPTGCADNHILKMNGAVWNCEADASGGTYTAGAGLDLTAGAFSIETSGVVTAMIGDDQVTADKIADGAIDAAAKLAAGLCSANQILKKRSDNSAWECAADATGAGLPAMTNAQIIVANGTTPSAVTMSGDVAIAASGATTIQTSAVETAMIGDDQVTAAKIADGAIDATAKLATGLCTDGQILKKVLGAWACGADDNTTTNAAVVTDGVTITGDGLSVMTAIEIATNGVDTLQLANGAVTFAKLNVHASCTAGKVLKISGSAWTCQDDVGVAISGTDNRVAIFNSAGTNVENSQITDNGTAGVNFANSKIQMGGSLAFRTVGMKNMFVGIDSGYSLDEDFDPEHNTSLGHSALLAVTTGGYNTAIGTNSLMSIQDGTFNTAIGSESTYSLTSGSSNTGVGVSNLAGVTTGNNNAAIGMRAGVFATTSSSGNVFIGHDSGPTVPAVVSNKLYIDNNADDTPLIYGDFANDRVGINKIATTYTLEVNGGVEATAYYYTSDRRVKENISTLDGALAKVLKLRGVSFDWIQSGEPEIGLIAQEVEEIYPDLVSTNNVGMKAVKYGNLVAPLIESTKELYGICKMSEAQTKVLSERVSKNERDIASLKSDLAKKQEQIDFLMRELANIKSQLKK